MICPYCGARAGCINSRQGPGSRMRRYRCPECSGSFTTAEILTKYDAQRIRPQALPKYRLAYREEGWRS